MGAIAFSGAFAVNNDGIYASGQWSDLRVFKFTLNGTLSAIVMNSTDECVNLFIDEIDNLYCSAWYQNMVMRYSLIDSKRTPTVVAGNRTAGNSSNLLFWPSGIHVDIKMNLYVADFGNNRIQFFQSGSLNGITLAGSGAPFTIALRGPNDIILDVDGYIFIADSGNNRIIGSGPYGFQCIAGCSGIWGSTANTLSFVSSITFDTYGSIYVADYSNKRIQKFSLATNSCGR